VERHFAGLFSSYEKGYEQEQILDLYRFINWVMILPETMERQFWQQLQTFEKERKVTYVTNAERFGFERGILEDRQEGRQEGIQEGQRNEGLSFVLRLLTRRFGLISPSTESQIRSLSLFQLEELGEALLDFSNLSDLSEWLRSRSVDRSESQA
jgi:hypothetical protein